MVYQPDQPQQGPRVPGSQETRDATAVVTPTGAQEKELRFHIEQTTRGSKGDLVDAPGHLGMAWADDTIFGCFCF